MVFGSYHPMGALYHHSVSITKARLAVKSLVASLASNNVEPGPRPQRGGVSRNTLVGGATTLVGCPNLASQRRHFPTSAGRRPPIKRHAGGAAIPDKRGEGRGKGPAGGAEHWGHPADRDGAGRPAAAGRVRHELHHLRAHGPTPMGASPPPPPPAPQIVGARRRRITDSSIGPSVPLPNRGAEGCGAGVADSESPTQNYSNHRT